MPDHKAALRRAAGLFSRATLEEYLHLYHPEARLHFLPPGFPPGRDGARMFYQAFFAAFPDARLTLEDLIAEDDKVACRFAVSSTHAGEFVGVAPSGKTISFSGITMFRFAEGSCVERWSESDLMAQLQQPGAA